jgi:threonine synthase
VSYDYVARLRARSVPELLSKARTFWDFAPLLPVDDLERRSVIDLGQGSTPLIAAAELGARIGLKRLFFKIEGANPTWSFKDRYVAVTVSVARAAGFRRVVASSTGNLAASVAAFAARAGLDAVVLCPPETSRELIALIASYGARVLIMDWDMRASALAELASAAGNFPVGLFMPGPISNPFGIEGYKTIAYELYQQLGSRIDSVVFPCARGNGLYGTWKGFKELDELCGLERRPRMIGVQPAGAASLPTAFARGAPAAATIDGAHSIATSIRESIASDAALHAIYASGGAAVSVNDRQIVEAAADLGSVGISAELASAAAFAGVRSLAAEGNLDEEAVVVCVLTSAGLKWPADLDRLRAPDVRHIATTKEAVIAAVSGQAQ